MRFDVYLHISGLGFLLPQLAFFLGKRQRRIAPFGQVVAVATKLNHVLVELCLDAVFVNAQPLHKLHSGIALNLDVVGRFVASIRHKLDVVDMKTHLFHVLEDRREAGDVID